MATLPGTNIVFGEWYPAAQAPPRLDDNEGDRYTLILGIKLVGSRSGFYDHSERVYYWHCERYDDFDDMNAAETDEERVGEINENLDWVYEPAVGVVCWLIIPTFDDNQPSIDGKTGYGTADWNKSNNNNPDDDDEESTPIVPITIHLN